MDELYTETFFIKAPEVSLKTEPQGSVFHTVKETQSPVFEAKKPVEPVEKPLVEVYETVNQLSYYLDQLEKALFENYQNSADFQFVFSKIRAKLKLKNTQGIPELLTELEELLDLS